MDITIEEAVATNIADPIDPEILEKYLGLPPFIKIPGTFNARDLSDGSFKSPIRSGYVYRCGSLEKLNEDGKRAIIDHGIKTVFDLRAFRERQQHPEPEFEGVENRWDPSTLDNDTTAQYQQPDRSKFSFTQMYVEMFETHKASIKAVLRHVHDHPDKPFLFHCTAGKDRTGLVAFVLFSLIDADISYINHDYALTRVGLDPVRDFLLIKLTSQKDVDLRSPTMQAYANVSLEMWPPVLQEVEIKYGGVRAYVREQLGFSDAEIDRIRDNLKLQSLSINTDIIFEDDLFSRMKNLSKSVSSV